MPNAKTWKEFYSSMKIDPWYDAEERIRQINEKSNSPEKRAIGLLGLLDEFQRKADSVDREATKRMMESEIIPREQVERLNKSYTDEIDKIRKAISEKPQTKAEDFVFRKAGDYWEMKFEGRKLPPLKHLDGFLYIRYLLSIPNKPISSIQLFHVKDLPVPDSNNLDASDLQSMGGSQDEQLRKAYYNIRQRIMSALKSIYRSDECGKSLYLYLNETISTGRYFVYSPAKGVPPEINWNLSKK